MPLRASVWCWLVLLGGVGCLGQSGVAATPGTAEGVLVEMATHAGVIFSGRVTAVERRDGAGYVDVRFRIDHAVRGCAGKTSYVLREWAGLWSGQVERYGVGERRLMLLTARGPSGMSAPVNGMDGAVPLVASVQPPVMDGNGLVAADPGVAGEPWVDLRWLQMRAVRGTVTRPRSEVAEGWAGPVKALPGLLKSQPTGPGLSEVIGLLDGSVELLHAR